MEAEKMNVHQLVDNYRRLEKQLAEKDAQIAELTAKLEEVSNRRNFLSKVAQDRLETMRDLEFELMAARCANGDVGKQTDEDPMEMEDLTVGLENV
jgi:chromosome segregation ATPase